MKAKCIDCSGETTSIRCRKCWRNSKHPFWKGDKVGYGSLHDYIKAHLFKPNKCQDCGEIKKLDLANKSQRYLRELSDWEWLCRKCHMIKDGRMSKFNKLKREHGVNGRFICVR